MRIGLVDFLNTRPLDFGIRIEAKKNSKIELVEDLPSRLAQKLLKGDIDIALISSVEYLRNKNTLNCVSSIGVCATNKADSLFYIRPKASKQKSHLNKVDKIYVDEGSRSTVALLKILYLSFIGILPEFETQNPEKIPNLLKKNEAGLLIGDAALRFIQDKKSDDFYITDLISWWHETQQLPFVTALWAYPKTLTIDENFFLESLESGLKNINQIANDATLFPNALEYLTKTLHYKINTLEKKALDKFEELLIQFELN